MRGTSGSSLPFTIWLAALSAAFNWLMGSLRELLCRARGQGQTYRNVVSTNEETSCAYGALLCDTMYVSPSSRLVSTMPSAHRWNREVSRCSKKNPWSQQRRTSDF